MTSSSSDTVERPAPPDASAADERNRRLRQADWRFLLPARDVDRALCLGGGALLAATRAVARDVTTDPAAAARDLAVAADPDSASLRAMSRALRPGGWCYTTWPSVLTRRPAVIRRRLGDAGFVDVVGYWPRPGADPATCEVWLPLDAPAALRHLLEHGPGSGAARIRAALRRVRWRLGPRLGAAAPLVAVARRPGPRPDGDLLATIRARWSDWGLGAPPERLSWLLFAPGRRPVNKLVALAFAEPTSRAVAVKLTRLPETVDRLRHEAAVLTALAERPALRGVPRVLFVRHDGDGLDVVQTPLRGRSMFAELAPANATRMTARAVDWLTQFATTTRAPGGAEDEVARVVTGFVERFGGALDRELVQVALELPSRLPRDFSVAEHRDFAPWNLLVSVAGELAVADWESAALRGMPAADLIYFLAYRRFVLDGAWSEGRRREAYRASRSAPELSAYAERIGLAAARLPALRLFTWLVHTDSDYRRLERESGTRPTSPQLRSSFFVTLLEEELGAQRAGAFA